MKYNKTMMQYFEWYYPENCTLWYKIKKDAQNLKNLGINMVWLPPAYKCASGIHDVGYGVYDLYDLGEFDQKGTVPTKYGLKDQYLEAIEALHRCDIKAIADVVFNQKMGADETEDVIACEVYMNDRNVISGEPYNILAWTKFNFNNRSNKYSSFKWNWTHFHGVDWDDRGKKSAIFKFYGKNWDNDVDKENGNFDYLMGADVDLNNVDVVEELNNWGKWYLKFCDLDGFRLDAIKHMRESFFKNWVDNMQNSSDKDLFFVGEYWNNNIDILCNYLNKSNQNMCLFDVPLHYNLYNASNSGGNYDMRKIFDGTLVQAMPNNAVTFVDNHDTQMGQALQSEIQGWFKPLAYALILLRESGVPCIFYGDYYGTHGNADSSIKTKINPILFARKLYAYGKQIDYFDDEHIIAWVREGDKEHKNSGLVVIMSDNAGGSKAINVGQNLANCVLSDITGNMKENVYVDKDGNGIFYCDGGSVSVWARK